MDYQLTCRDRRFRLPQALASELEGYDVFMTRHRDGWLMHTPFQFLEKYEKVLANGSFFGRSPEKRQKLRTFFSNTYKFRVSNGCISFCPSYQHSPDVQELFREEGSITAHMTRKDLHSNNNFEVLHSLYDHGQLPAEGVADLTGIDERAVSVFIATQDSEKAYRVA